MRHADKINAKYGHGVSNRNENSGLAYRLKQCGRTQRLRQRIWHYQKLKKKKVLNWVFLRQWVYCSGTLSITFLVMWGGGWGEGEINVVLNTHTYSSLSTIPNMYIIYQHRRDDRPLELWGKSQTLTYDDWHWALQLVKKIYK